MASQKRRMEIFNMYSGKCAYCGQGINLDTFHIDHMIAKSKGGKGGNNYVPSCQLCNVEKSNMDIEEFRNYIEQFAYHTAGKLGLACKYWDIKPIKIKFYFEEINNGNI